MTTRGIPTLRRQLLFTPLLTEDTYHFYLPGSLSSESAYSPCPSQAVCSSQGGWADGCGNRMLFSSFCFHLGWPWLCLLQGPCLPSFQRFLSGTFPPENALPLVLFKGITNWGTWQEKPGTCFSSIRSPDSVSGAGDPEINEIYLLCPLTVSRRDEDRANNSCLGRHFMENVTFDMDHAKWGGVNWMMSKRYFPSEGEMLMKSYNWENAWHV